MNGQTLNGQTLNGQTMTTTSAAMTGVLQILSWVCRIVAGIILLQTLFF